MDELELTTRWVANGKLNVQVRNGKAVYADRVDPVSQVSRMRFLVKLSEAIPGVDRDAVESHLLAQLDAPREQAVTEDDPTKASDDELAKMPEEVVAEAYEMLRDPELIPRVLYDHTALGVTGEYGLILSLYLLGTSRLLQRPLAAVVQGSSSSGKSYVIERVASLFPEEATILATDLTPNSLYYLPQGALRHRFIVAGERSRKEDDDRAEATRALREMISSRVLRKAVPITEGNRMVTQVIESPGPIAYVESTTLPELFDEDRNRMLMLGSDESDEQTRRVVDSIASQYANPMRTADTERILARHHAAQRLLRRVVVRVPFAARLASAMPTERPEARRAIHQALGVVQAVALLHQFQRTQEPQHDALIEATVADYEIARGLLIAPLGRSLGGALPEHVTYFGAWLKSTVKAEPFTVLDLPAKSGCRWPESTIYRLVATLRGVGFLAEAGQDGRRNRYQISGPLPVAGAEWLPTPDCLGGGS